MGRGRKPQSTAAKEAKGSFDRHPERRNHNEPKPKEGRPERPLTIDGDEVACLKWEQVLKLLEGMHLLTTADGDLIESYCINESMLRSASESIKEHGTMMVEDGKYKKNPDCVEWNKAMDRRTKLQAELGLTPSARTRLTAISKDEDDVFAKFMEGMASARN